MIAVIGRKTGQVASELLNIIYNDNKSALLVTDITDTKNVINFMKEGVLKGVINAAAMTNVDACEENPETANDINGNLPAIWAIICDQYNIPFVHISTDYVFDGTRNHYFSSDYGEAPVNCYGYSKLIGEQNILAEKHYRSVIVRTSWVFAEKSLEWIHKCVTNGHEIKAATGLWGSPTSARDVAGYCYHLLKQLMKKIYADVPVYHCSGPKMSKDQFIRDAANSVIANNTPIIKYTSIASLGMKAKRPKKTVLVHTDIGYDMHDTQKEIERCLSNIKTKELI